VAITATIDSVPKRTNFFQQIVAILHHHVKDDATTVVESEELTERSTGIKREVDVVIRRTVAGHEVVVGVEATAKSAPADVTWIDEMLAKHTDLPTARLVLVSESGFTSKALMKAEARGVVTMAPTDLQGSDFQGKLVGQLQKIWPKSVELKFDHLYVTAEAPGGTVTREVPFDVALYRDDGTEACTPLDIFRRWFDSDFSAAAEMIGLTEFTDDIDQWFRGGANPPWNVDGIEIETLYLRDETGQEVEHHRLLSFEITGRASIRVGEVTLTHKSLGDVEYAYGETLFDGQPTRFVASLGADGEQAAIVFDSGTAHLKAVP
jgi:hypothetical protein